MTIRRWLTFASAAALLAGVGACNDNNKARGTDTTGTTSGTSATSGTSGSAAAPEGRRGENLPRARAPDAGLDLGAPGSVSSPKDTTSGSSSGENATPTAPASGTTPGGTGQTPSNGTSGDTTTPPGK